jgi:hypothetical protein
VEIDYFIDSLQNSAVKIEAMLRDMDLDAVRWKPEPAMWSMLEVINHLLDEEREDFRIRLDIILHHPDKSWPGINPPGWVTERGYNKKDPQISLSGFLAERQKSLHWLRSLVDPDLGKSYNHPSLGSLTAGDLLAAWAAHDYRHLRQLADLHARYLTLKAVPFSTRYAGP